MRWTDETRVMRPILVDDQGYAIDRETGNRRFLSAEDFKPREK